MGADNGEKMASRNADGSFGVDLNRNWGIDWANCTGAKGTVPVAALLLVLPMYTGVRQPTQNRKQ